MSALALVTGASSGIGQTFAERLAGDGRSECSALSPSVLCGHTAPNRSRASSIATTTTNTVRTVALERRPHLDVADDERAFKTINVRLRSPVNGPYSEAPTRSRHGSTTVCMLWRQRRAGGHWNLERLDPSR